MENHQELMGTIYKTLQLSIISELATFLTPYLKTSLHNAVQYGNSAKLVNEGIVLPSEPMTLSISS